MRHELKVWPEEFNAINELRKQFEFRLNDRDFKVYDELWLQEYLPDKEVYTGRVIRAMVTYIVYGEKFGIPKDYCVMSINTFQYLNT